MDEAETDIDRTATPIRAPRHAARVLAAITIALAALLLAVWIAPRASGAAAGWMQAPAVRLHTLRVPGDDKLAGRRRPAREAPAPRDPGRRHAVHHGRRHLRRPPRRRGRHPPAHEPRRQRLGQLVRGSARGRRRERRARRRSPIRSGQGPGGTCRSRPRGAAGAAPPPCRASGSSPSTRPGTEASPPGVTGAARKLAATVAGIGVAPPADAASSAPVIVTRSEWGADESLRQPHPLVRDASRMAFVHHTASGNDYAPTDAPGLVRAIYAYHTKSLGWSDIGYNFLVDRFGTIYEGGTEASRAASSAPTSVGSTPHSTGDLGPRHVQRRGAAASDASRPLNGCWPGSSPSMDSTREGHGEAHLRRSPTSTAKARR